MVTQLTLQQYKNKSCHWEIYHCWMVEKPNTWWY